MHPADRNLVIMSFTARNGEEFNLWAPRSYMPVLIKQWVFDLQSIEMAAVTGSPMPGKPVSQSEKIRTEFACDHS